MAAARAKPEQLLVEADEAARQLGATREQRRAGLIAIEVIRAAAAVTTRNDELSNQRLLQEGTRPAWRKGSGDAHGRFWQVMDRLRAARSQNPEAGLAPA